MIGICLISYFIFSLLDQGKKMEDKWQGEDELSDSEVKRKSF